MNYTVYTITENLQGRIVYVGETNDFERRVKEHLSLRSHTKDWISSIGVENITITPIAEFSTEEEALWYEDELILKYDTIEDGFNKQRSGLISSTDKNAYQNQRQKHLYATNEEYRKNILENHKRYRQAHMEEIREQVKRYRQAHMEEIREQVKQYYQSHKEQKKRYRDEHKEQRMEYDKLRYQKKKAEKQIQIDIANTPEGRFVELTIPF